MTTPVFSLMTLLVTLWFVGVFAVISPDHFAGLIAQYDISDMVSGGIIATLASLLTLR